MANPRNCLYFGTNPFSHFARGAFYAMCAPFNPLINIYRYAADLTPDQKDALLDVVRANPHPQIGPEVRRELVNSVARGEPRPAADQDVQMS